MSETPRAKLIIALAVASAVAVAAGPALSQVVTDPAAPPPPAVTDPTAPPTPPKPTKPGEGPPSPFTFTAAYTADLLANLRGGQKAGPGYVDLIKLSAAYDGGNAGHEGLTGLVSVEHANGANFTGERVGGFQSVSGSEAQPAALRLYEVWLQREMGKGAIKAGLIDISTTFDVQETAALFLNASHGIAPELGDTGLNGPSDYPTTALAVTTVYRPAEGWTAQLGVFDGVTGDPDHRGRFVAVKLSARDGAFVIAQLEKRFGDVARLEAGGWTYTAAFPSLVQIDAPGSPRSVRGNGGVYGLIEGRLLGGPQGNGGSLSGWLRAGVANGDINRAETYLGGGLVYTGLIPGREKDDIGVAFARAGFGEGARREGAREGLMIGGSETDLEVTYRYAFRDWLNIQPDVQYVIRPGGDQRLGNALIIGLRLAFTVSK